MRWQSFWFEREVSLQNQLGPGPELKMDPLFVLGLWRSGTTYLHELIGACPGMSYPATWQCMRPSSFCLQQPPMDGRSIQRPMDAMTISALSPQEDEFALLALGCPSVYRGFFDPRRLDDLAELLNPDFWEKEYQSLQDVWLPFLRRVSNGSVTQVVLKSPNHSFRVRILPQIFPQARYVWLVRDPIETFYSNIKMWSAMFERYALWPWDGATLERFLAAAMEKAADCISFACDTFPKQRLVVVRFDQLISRPVQTICAANARLSFGDQTSVAAAASDVVLRMADHRNESYNGRPEPGALKTAVARLRAAQEQACASHGI